MTYDGKESTLTGPPREPGRGVRAQRRQVSADPSTLLSAALNPSSVAIIGASDNPNKVGGRPLSFLARFGYKGRIYPINPNRDEVQGFRTFPDLSSLPESPELVIVAAPGSQVVRAVDDCASRGVGAAIVMASGYGETADVDAIAAERTMVERARAAGMRLIGPNSQGLANFGSGTIASFSTMFVEVEPADGPVAIVSQSGMMSTSPYGLLRGKGIGVRHAHATGNDADVTLSEVALAVVQDPAVRLLLLYIESIRDPDVLAQVAAIARDRDVPIVAVKSGRTARGQAAARSHTGALANEDRVVSAFFERHGIWRARDVHELVAAAEAYLKGWRPHRNRVAVVSNSGASCVMGADTIHDLDLELARLADGTVAQLASHLPSFATVTNPVDITAALLTDSRLFGRILSILAEDANVDSLFVAMPVAGTGYDVPAFAGAAAAYAEETKRVVVVATPQESVQVQFRAAGVPTFDNESEALAVIDQLTRHAAMMRRTAFRQSAPVRADLPPGTSSFLDEARSLAFLQSLGLPTIEHRVCCTAESARDAYRHFGASVVLKACSSAFPHKSDHGLVTLDVNSELAAVAAYHSLQARLHALGVEAGVIVAPMLTTRRELVLGAKVDPMFGPVLMVGDGGRYVEALGDIALVLAPASIEDVRDALRRLRIAPLLGSVRGEPPLDTAALCAAAVRLGEIIVALQDQIASIDVNPVMVGPQGSGVVLVDALIERRQPARPAGVRHDPRRP